MVGEIRQETGNPSALRAAHGLEKIREFCRGTYRVLREGKTSGRQRVVKGMGGSEVLTENEWGIRFHCTE